MIKTFFTWKFLFVILAVTVVNVAAVGVLYFSCSYGVGLSALPPAERFVARTFGPISRAILKPQFAFCSYPPYASPLIVLAEAVLIYGAMRLLCNALFKRE